MGKTLMTLSGYKRLCRLAMLDASEPVNEAIKRNLNSFFSYAERIQSSTIPKETDTGMNHKTVSILRDDIPSESLSMNDILKNAPCMSGVFFSVPQVIFRNDKVSGNE